MNQHYTEAEIDTLIADAIDACVNEVNRRTESTLAAILAEHVLLPRVPGALEVHIEAIADCLVDAIVDGARTDDLDIDGHIREWLE